MICLSDSFRKKLAHREGNFLNVRLQCEVSGIEKLDTRIWVVAEEGLGACRQEIGIVLPPDREQRRPPFPKIVVEGWVQLHVVCVVKKQIELNVGVAGSRHQRSIKRIAFGRDHLW